MKPLLKPETVYTLRETYRRLGPGAIFKYLVLISLVIWAIWPSADSPKPMMTSQQQKALQREPLPPVAENTEKDLREQMTSTQSGFYWDSFTWMMEHGPELKTKSFDGKVIFMSYVKDVSFKAENGLLCIPYSEKLFIAGKYNIRRGIGCRLKPGSWCRQAENEKSQCRLQDDGGLTSLSSDTGVTLHNLKTGWDRNLHDWGF